MIDAQENTTTTNDQIESSDFVDWENPPTLYELKRNLEEALTNHNAHVADVDKWLELLRANKKLPVIEGRSKVQPKLVRKQAEWRYPALEEPFLSVDDMFIVDPVTAQDVDAARQNQLVLNKQFRVDINKVAFINKYVRTAVNTGTSILKLSWETQEGDVLEEVPVYTKTPEETMQYIQMAVQQGQMDEQQAQQMMQNPQPIQIGTQPQMVHKEVINRPVIEVKDSRDVIIDPSCEGVLDNARFVIDCFTTDLSTLRADGRYKNLDHIKDEDYTNTIREFYSDDKNYLNHTSFKFDDKPRKKLVAYEYWGFWDIHKTGVVEPFVATWVGNTLIRLEENPYPDKKVPFVVVQYLPPDDDCIYGDADASLLEDNQQIIGAVTRSIIDLIGRSANAQTGVRKDLLDPINRGRFNKGLDFEFNPVNDLGSAIYMTKMPEIPQSAMAVIQLQTAEAEALTGTKAFSQGISGESLGNSVGGIRSALDATAKREVGILRRLSDGLKDAGRKIMTMNAHWLSDEEIIRITDEEFVAIHRSDLAGNFDLRITVSTAEVDNQKASELAFMLQTMGNSVPFDLTKMVLIKIAQLRKLPDLADAIQNYQPQPDPMQQQMVQLQMQLLQAQIANEQAKAQENATDVELKKAKTENELAKAGKTRSETDKIDLDYINNASGIDYQRDAEARREQLQNQYDIASMKEDANDYRNRDNNLNALQQSLIQAQTAMETAKQRPSNTNK